MKALLKSVVEVMIEALVPPGHVCPSVGLRQRLRETPLVVADVGAAMGIDPRWKPLGERTCKFITFEPDVRSHERHDNDGPFEMLALPTALGNESGMRTLYLAAGPFASSFHRPNEAAIGSFGSWPWYETVGEEELPVERLDDLLSDRPQWMPDFIKTDVEGADLDVLKGGRKALDHALGVQVEVQFVERNEGTPLFTEVDGFLREAGFGLVALQREHWNRTGYAAGPRSEAQLVWADAIYFREIPSLLARVEAQTGERRDALLTKMVALLLAYGFHDFAAELADRAADAELCSAALKYEVDVSVAASAAFPGRFAMRARAALALAGLMRLAALPFGATAREVMRQIYRRRAAELHDHLSREYRRAGYDYSSYADFH